MEAFKYIDNSPAVYLHCDVIVCDSSDTSSRCASGCFTTNPGRRAARDVARAAMSGGFRLEGRYLNSQSSARFFVCLFVIIVCWFIYFVCLFFCLLLVCFVVILKIIIVHIFMFCF